MKINYISNSRIPTEKAHGLQIIRMAEAFAKNGHELTLIVPRRINPIKKNPFEFYSSERNFKIKYLPILDTVSLGKWGFIFASFQFALLSSVYSLFKKSDLVFTRDEILAFLNILIGKKVYWETHTGAYNFFARFVLKNAEKIIVISEGLEEFYKEKGFSGKTMIVAHDAIRVEDFQFDFNRDELQKELKLPSDKPIVMYTGHLYDWKGADLLAESSKLLPEYNFIFIGGTEIDIKNFKEKYTNENIFFLGFKENKIIPKYLKTANLLVIPNTDINDISSKFTSPLKFFEYLASGVPVLSSDITSLKNIGKDYVAYFKTGNVDDLANQIKSCIEGGCNNLPKPLYLNSWNQRAKDIIEKK